MTSRTTPCPASPRWPSPSCSPCSRCWPRRAAGSRCSRPPRPTAGPWPVPCTCRSSASTCRAAAGLLIVVGLVTLDGAPGWLRWLAPLGLFGFLALSRPVLHLMMHIGRRITRHVPDSDHLPPERAVAVGFIWTIVNIGLFALSYAVILHSIEPGTPILGAASAFALAWVIGFLVLPIPSGLGIREAVLYATLPGVPAAAVLASSLAHRVATFGAELLLTAFSQARRKHDSATVDADVMAS